MTEGDPEAATASDDTLVADPEASSSRALPPTPQPSSAWVDLSSPSSATPPPAGVTPPASEPPPYDATPPSGVPMPPFAGRSSTGPSYTGPPVWSTAGSSLPGTSSAGGSSGEPIYQIIQAVSDTDPENIQQVAASQLALSVSYYQNVLSQARRSFIAAIISATVGLLFFIAAVSIFLVRNDVRAGTVSVVAGAIVEVISGLNFWLYGRTASQLNLFHIRLERTQIYLLANSISTKLTGEARDSALTNLINTMAAQGAGHNDPAGGGFGKAPA